MTLSSKLKRQKYWHDATILMSIFIISAFAGLLLKDHLFASFENVLAPKRIHEISYKIVAGDTLWMLASETVRNDEDVRDKIIAIRKLNGLTPTQSLMPGQILKIPIKRLEDSGLRYTFKDAN